MTSNNQEVKETQFKSYDWSTNEKWQSYLKNVYPMPPLNRLEKMKRKWYKNNVDKDFDVDFVSTSTSSSSQPSSSGNANATSNNRGGAGQAPPPPQGGYGHYNQYNPFFPEGMRPGPDLKPEMKGPQFAAWIFFVVCYITGIISPTWVCFGALACGIIRKGGFPRADM